MGGKKESKTAHDLLIFTKMITQQQQKYGTIAFDKNQKALLTSCLLYYRKDAPVEEETDDLIKEKKRPVKRKKLNNSNGVIPMPCCFSFTVRRDKFNM